MTATLRSAAPAPPATSPRSELDLAQQLTLLRVANAVAHQALQDGHHPFGAVLVAPDGHTVLLRQGNVDAVNHAEAVLAREAARLYPHEFLWDCTLVTTVEPCCMCAGTQYWAHIGRLVYGISESDLLALTGNHAENPTLALACREVFARGQKAMQVWGPIGAVDAALADEITALHRDFWSGSRADRLSA
ncbi:MAG: nucleoside deaminase [Leptothrix sp. (in: b-proteobacteria)]